MIVGVGCDLVPVERLERALRRHPGILERVFTPAEVEQARRKRAWVESLAGRFAAKEACLKALGTGLRGCSWRDVEVVRGRGGRPALSLAGGAAAIAAGRGIARLHLSIAHDGGLAMAQVVAEGAGS